MKSTRKQSLNKKLPEIFDVKYVHKQQLVNKYSKMEVWSYSIYDDTHERIHAYQFCIQSKSFSTVQLSIPVGLDIFKDPAFVLRFFGTFLVQFR